MIDVRPFLELGGGESRAYFPARRVVSETGELSHCVLIVTDDAVLQVSPQGQQGVGGGALRVLSLKCQ